MRTEGTSLDHRPTAIIPPIVCTHPDDVAEVRVAGEYRLTVRFHDGTSGFVELGNLIRSPQAGVFAELRDPAVFAAVTVELGAVTWPGGIDLAPDAMYAELRASREWILE